MAKDIEKRVIDFTEFREQKLEEKRRGTERVLMNHFLGVYAVSNGGALHQVELIDLSDTGCSFQIPIEAQKKWDENPREFQIRLYFSQDTFLTIHVNVQNSRAAVANGTRYNRYGCSVETHVSTYPAYVAFVKFLKAYAAVSEKDGGDVNVFFV